MEGGGYFKNFRMRSVQGIEGMIGEGAGILR